MGMCNIIAVACESEFTYVWVTSKIDFVWKS
ncbi:hypothetical protein SAMN05660206_109109 [Sphingobacterium wenxiniae]|uniref:Uncharacterized protein n=1 Tax=Sphingobacterium wenxiniae TaxID=683125 RepID=A0A1I6UM82_9SPHI|nr:hypothetical protein SAMN05660206_109109 [Sphingobacterium wenxiniae]